MRTIKVIIYIVLGFSLLLGGFHFSFADTIQLSDHAPVIGSIITQNAGTGIFNFNDPDLMPHEVIIDGSGGYIFTGSFFLTDLNNGGTTNNYGWVTFNFGPTLSGGINTTSYRAKLITTVNPDELTMTGFAWSSGAGWIYFGEMTLSDGTTTKITYNKNRGNFSGYAWSENLGWIPMNGLKVDLNPPTLSGSTIFAASSSKLITIEDNSPISGLYKLEITNWDNNAYKIHTGTTLSFTHDFRKAKSYDAILTDPSGNSRSINSAFTVVANEPATLDTTTNIGTDPIYGGPSATGSFFKVKADNDVIADLEEKHTIDILLRDKYGNVVKTEPSIKTVDVNVLFNSTMQSKQINNIFSDGGSNLNPVIFKSDVGSTDAFSTPYISTSTYTYTGGLTNSGRYIIDIESFAPSLGGNNLNLLGFSYKVENNPSYTGVGETSKSCTNSSCDSIFNTTFTDFIGGSTIEYTFNAPIRIQDVQNTNKFRGKIDIPEIITTTLAKNTLSTSVTGILLASVIDVIGKEEPFSLSNFSNQFISYQTPNTTSVSQCNGYNKIFNPIYFNTNSLCNRSSSGSSNNIINIGDIGSILSSGTNFSTTWTPKNVGEFIYTNNKVEFRNELSYYVGGNQVFINGLLTNDSLAGFTNGVIETNPSLVSAGGDTINMTVKIIGSSNSTDKISNVLTGSTNELMQLGQISKNGIKDMMRKNASFITNGMTSGSKARGVYYNNGNYSTGGLVGVNTIVVKGGDLTITGDIAGDLKGIIVIKDKDGNGGNIIIDQNVQYIHALIFAEKSIFASGGINAINQLYVKGGIVSDNTIGGANKNPPICPYNVNCDSNDTAKKYDFNYFRYFSYGNGIAEGTVEGTMTGTRLGELSSPIPPIGDSKKYPFVIEHDPAGQSNPPPGFSMKSK